MSADLTTTPSADDFRALARSSPWLFTTLHWRHDATEAWLDRATGRLTVRGPSGQAEVVEGVPYSTSRLVFAGEGDGTGQTDPTDTDEPVGADALVRRADGLVLQRPEGWHFEHGDPMWGNYAWTAMLDPVELADGVGHEGERPAQDEPGVRVSEVREVTHRGRRTWQALCQPVVDAYDPRCGCCPLLDSVASRLVEYGPEDPNLAVGRESLPTTYLVSLDVRTGIVVDLSPWDGTGGSSLTNEIYAVDEELSPPPAAP